jgi:hypothetical protein
MQYTKTSMLSVMKRHAVVASIIVACLPAGAQCYNLSFNQSPGDSVVGTGSPFTYTYYNTNSTLYVNHGNAPNYIMQDNSGSLNSPSSTGIAVGNGGLGDVTAAQLGTNVYMSYLSTSNVPSIAVSPDNVGWPTTHPFTVSGGYSANPLFTPTLIAYNGVLVAAFVYGSDVYVATSSNGQVFNVAGIANSSYGTLSRPAMAVLNNNLYLAYTTSGGTLVIGTIYTNGTFSPNLAIQPLSAFGNSKSKNVLAGVALLGDVFSGQMWVFGQETGSSQFMEETYGTGTAFQTAFTCTYAQLRYTPSISQFPGNGFTFIVFQGDHNTNVWYGAN